MRFTEVNQRPNVILLVDDDPHVLSLGQELLEHMGYQVLIAADGQQAVNLYQAKNPRIDLVIMDYLLPRRDGYEILQQLRRLDPEARVIVASGFFGQAESAKLRAAGAVALIHKPYRVKELEKMIKKALGEKG